MAGEIQICSSDGRQGLMFSDFPQFLVYLGYYSGTMLFYILNLIIFRYWIMSLTTFWKAFYQNIKTMKLIMLNADT